MDEMPWGLLAKSNRKKLFAERKMDSYFYYHIGGEVKDSRHDWDKVVVLEDRGRGHGRILTDIPADREGGAEVFREMPIDLAKLGAALDKVIARQEKGDKSYNPDDYYLVPKKKAGRPVRTLTADEAEKIQRLRADSWGYLRIAKEMKMGVKRIRDYLNSLS